MKIDFSQPISLYPESDFEVQVAQFVEEFFNESNSVSVQTSGSTGKPKVFEIEKERMRHSAKMTCDILGLKEGDTALLCLPVEYISGKMMVVRAIERKLKLMVITPSINPLQELEEEIVFCAMSPLQVENSLDKIHWIKNMIIGGAAVSESLKRNITETLIAKQNSSKENRIYETYGMSETLSHIALKQIFPIADEYFQVLEGIDISKDEQGCLVINAPQLNPIPLETNDLVEIIHHVENQHSTKKFKFLGRIDNVINSAGLKIHPEELENLVKKEISNELIFAGIKDELLGQKLALIVEGQENAELLIQLNSLNYPTKNHQPKEIIFVEAFPRIPNGKIDRQELTKIICNRF